MRSSKRLLLMGTLVFGLAVTIPATAPGYEQYNGGSNPSCNDCHPNFDNGDPLHELHQGSSQMTNTCNLCHGSTGDNPFTYQSGATGGQGCRGCHGVDNGTTFGWGAGLRLHHANAGAPADGDGLFCVDCHGGDPAPNPESRVPVYYSRGDVNVTDPCVVPSGSGGEDWDGDGFGLDNDGDLDYEASDADCSTAVEGSTWGKVKSLYR